MKKYFLLLTVSIILFSCSKDSPGSGRANPFINHPPVANAGADQTINYPINTITLDGSNSIDPDNNISSYHWTKISGPNIYFISNPNQVKTTVNNLIPGVYLFELKVIDAGGLISKDSVQVTLYSSTQSTPNVLFFFRDTTGGLDAQNITVIEGFTPRIILARVRITNYPDAAIEGVWSRNYSPWCPISSIYVDATAFGTFNLPPGTYNWIAESVTTNLDTYPVPNSFRQYWEGSLHTAQGTITVPPNNNCIIKEIVF